MAIFDSILLGVTIFEFLFRNFGVQLLLVTGFAVGLVVEVVEEIVEEDGVGQREDDRPARVAAVIEQELRRVQERNAELELK